MREGAPILINNLVAFQRFFFWANIQTNQRQSHKLQKMETYKSEKNICYDVSIHPNDRPGQFVCARPQKIGPPALQPHLYILTPSHPSTLIWAQSCTCIDIRTIYIKNVPSILLILSKIIVRGPVFQLPPAYLISNHFLDFTPLFS